MDPRTALLQQETDDSKGFRNKSIGMHNLRAKLREQLKGYSHVRGFPLEPEYKRDAADSLTARRDSIRRRNSSVTKQQETESADEPKYKPRRLRKKQESLLVPRLLWFSVYLSLCFVAFKGMKYFTSETEVKLCQPCSGECGVLDEEFTIPVDSLGDLPFGTVFPRQSNLQCRSSMCVPGYVADPNALCRVVSDEALLYHTRRLLSAEDSLDDNNERFLAYFKSRALAETGIAGALSPTGSPVVPTPAATTRPTPAATTTPIPATTSTPTPAATTPATPAATTRPTPTVTTTPTPAITIPSITIPSIPSLTPRPGTPSNTPSSTPGGFLQPTTRQPSSDDNRPGSPGSNGGNQGQGGDRGGSPEGNRPGSPGSNGGNQGQGGDRGGKSTEEQNTRSSDGTPSGRTTENRDSGSQPSRTFEGPTSTPAATTAGRSSEDQSTRTPPAETPTPSSTATPPTSSGTPPPTPDAGTPPPTSGTPPPTGTPPRAQAPSPSANDGLLSAGAYYNDPNLPWATGAEGGAGGNCNTLQYAPVESNGYANLTTTYYRGIRNVQNYAQCCGICANDPNCAGWVRVAGGDPSVMNCYLKSSLTMDANAGASAYNWQPTDARWPPNPAVRYTGGVPIMFESGTMGTPLPQIMYGCPYPPTADGSCTPPAGCNCGGGVCHGPCLAPSATSRSAQTPSSSL